MSDPNPSDLSLKPNLCYFGTASSGDKKKTFGILQEDRRRHMYVIGKTGMGKTTLLENMILQDIYNGYGVAFVDPHGDPSEYILDRIPTHRQQDVVYLNPADTEYPIGLNILEARRGEEPFLIASSLMAVFYKIWAGMWSSRMEYILNNTLLALLETPGNTLLDVVKMLTDDDFRLKTVSKLNDPLVKNFWNEEFANFNSRYKQEAISPILNKIGQFLSSEVIRNIVGQKHSTIDLREIMDEKKILIVNLSKGRLGEDNSNLFGSLLFAKLQVAAMSRVDIVEDKREDFFLYVDEFQNFTTDSFAGILSEARKYRLNLILAHQYISQLTESGNSKVKNAIFGNVGTMLTFRIGSEDASLISKEFSPVFSPQELLNLDPKQIALKLSIQGKASKPFLATTLAPIFDKLNGNFSSVVNLSRQLYAKQKNLVVVQINENFNPPKNSEAQPSKKHKQQSPHNSDEKPPANTIKNQEPEIAAKTSPKTNPPEEKVISHNITEIRLPLKTNSRLKLKDRLNFMTPSGDMPKIVAPDLDKFDETKEIHGSFSLPD